MFNLNACISFYTQRQLVIRTISTTCGFEKSILDCILPYTTYISNIWHIAIYMIAIEKVKNISEQTLLSTNEPPPLFSYIAGNNKKQEGRLK